MLRLLAILFGIGFIFIGVAGFLSLFIIQGLLFGLYEVNTVNNIFALGSGVLAIMAATSYRRTKHYFQLLGLIFMVLAVIGIATGGDLRLIMMHVNMADNIFRIIMAAIFIYLGFSRD